MTIAGVCHQLNGKSKTSGGIVIQAGKRLVPRCNIQLDEDMRFGAMYVQAIVLVPVVEFRTVADGRCRLIYVSAARGTWKQKKPEGKLLRLHLKLHLFVMYSYSDKYASKDYRIHKIIWTGI